MKPKVKLACMTWVYRDHSFEDALQHIAEAGYRYVSFGLPHQGVAAFADGEDPVREARRVRQLLDRHGLEPVSLVSTDVLAANQPLELAKKRLEFAKGIGVDELLSLGTWGYRDFPHTLYTPEEMKPWNDAFAEKYRAVGEEAGKVGCVVTIKPHTGNTATAGVILETLREIGSAHVKASYDPGNVRFYEGIEPEEGFAELAAQTESIVAKDHQGARGEGNFPIPGEGEVHFPVIFDMLFEAGFTGPVILERLDGAGQFGSNIAIKLQNERVVIAKDNLTKLLTKAGFDV